MSVHHPDHRHYQHFTKPQRVDKAVQTLKGLLLGVAIDDELNAAEIAEVVNWCNEYRDLIGKAPFNELIPKLDEILKDGVVDPDEQEDLLWLCKNLSTESEYFDHITNSIQQLHGVLHGIMADDHVSLEEAKALQVWLGENDQLKGTYPYDELDAMLMSILEDGIIDEEEQAFLKAFFEDFIECSFVKKVKKESARVKSGLPKEFTLPGVCASCPDILFDGRTFTFTGSSMKGTRKELVNHIQELGGEFSSNLTKKTEYLVIGSAGNPCWAFSCYGRKVEKAVKYRKEGRPVIIVHESDFWDAVEDLQE